MAILEGTNYRIEQDKASPVWSHQSYDPQVEAICHHSGRYLTGSETNPIWKQLLREQHDFPGLPRLDRAFSRAAHSAEHQHVIWSAVGIEGLAHFFTGALVLILVTFLFFQQYFVPGGTWFIIFWVGVGLLAAFGALLIIIGLSQGARREALYHRQARGLPPAIADYPLEVSYHLRATESIMADLNNMSTDLPRPRQARGQLVITLNPTPNDWETLTAYRHLYEGHDVGQYAHAGSIAMQQLQHLAIDAGPVEFGHRVVLRYPTADLTFDEGGQQWSPFQVKVDYHLLEQAVFQPHNGFRRFPLEVEPRLSPRDSRTLEVHFYWRGPGEPEHWRLDECILNVPDELGLVTRVTFGRYDHEKQQVIWRNRSFRQRNLVFSISFENPILGVREITGRPLRVDGVYRFSYAGLLSGLELRPDLVWTSLGFRASQDTVTIEKYTSISGRLALELQRLSQEHEYVQQTPVISCPFPPTEGVIEAVLKVLLQEGFDLQRIVRAAPRLDPMGRLDKQLLYWDIAGRRYNPELLDSLDIHVVVSGVYSTNQGNNDAFQPRTTVDLRVRSLHDPRNQLTPASVDALVGGTDQFSLAQKIHAAIDQQQSLS